MSRRTNNRRLQVESLEGRQLMAGIGLNNGVQAKLHPDFQMGSVSLAEVETIMQ